MKLKKLLLSSITAVAAIALAPQNVSAQAQLAPAAEALSGLNTLGGSGASMLSKSPSFAAAAAGVPGVSLSGGAASVKTLLNVLKAKRTLTAAQTAFVNETLKTINVVSQAKTRGAKSALITQISNAGGIAAYTSTASVGETVQVTAVSNSAQALGDANVVALENEAARLAGITGENASTLAANIRKGRDIFSTDAARCAREAKGAMAHLISNAANSINEAGTSLKARFAWTAQQMKAQFGTTQKGMCAGSFSSGCQVLKGGANFCTL